MKQKGFIEIALVLMGGFVLFVFIILGADFFMTMKNGVGWVWQDRHGTAVKEFQKEENGCIYFIDVWGSSSKICGHYQITNY